MEAQSYGICLGSKLPLLCLVRVILYPPKGRGALAMVIHGDGLPGRALPQKEKESLHYE